MSNDFKVILLMLPWLTHSLESPELYRPNSFISHVGATSDYRRDSRYFVPSFSSDLLPEESKETTKRSSSKKIPLRLFDWDDDEFSDEKLTSVGVSNAAFGSNKNDNREYAIGTQIHVQHPISVAKKASRPFGKATKLSKHGTDKSSSYTDKEVRTGQQNASAKSHTDRYTQLYEALEPTKIVSPLSSIASSYNVYEPDQEESQHLSRPKTSHSPHQFKSVASKKQIEEYLKDQQKLLDEALKIQLLKDPRFQQYLKSKEKKRINEHFDSDELQNPSNPTQEFRSNYEKVNVNGIYPRRSPQKSEFVRPIKVKPQVKHKASSLPRRFRSAIVINV